MEKKKNKGKRYLSFVIEKETYCIAIEKVKEIIAKGDITKIPRTPEYISGVINLRGKIIPIVDLRKLFNFPVLEDLSRACVVIIDFFQDDKEMLIGITVDATQEVINLTEKKISEIPYINSKIKNEYIKGIGEVGDSIVILLDIDKVLTEEEFVSIKKSVIEETESLK